MKNNHCRRLLAALVACLLLVGSVVPAMAEEAVEGLEISTEPVEEFSVAAAELFDVEPIEGFTGDEEILSELIDTPILEEEIELDLPAETEAEAPVEEEAVMPAEGECDHEGYGTYTDWDDEVTYTEKPGDNRYHIYKDVEYRITRCSNCDAELSREVDYSYSSSYYNHNYVNGVCADCGHVNTCEHEDKYPSSSWNNDVKYEPLDLKYHNATGTKTTYDYCPDCGQRLDVVENVPFTEKQRHDYDSETGKCYDCGFVNTCTHPNAEEDGYFTGSWEDRVYTAISDQKHTVTGKGVTYKYCDDCGMSYDYKRDVDRVVEEWHSYWDDDYEERSSVCRYCKHQCTHSGQTEKEWSRDYNQQPTYKVVDNRYHEVTTVGTSYDYCYTCYTRFNEVPNVTKTTKERHNYNEQGVCENCANVCTHTNSDNYYGWDWDDTQQSTYTYVDNEYHNRAGKATVYHYCVDCYQRYDVQAGADRVQSERHTFDENGLCTKCGNGCAHTNTDERWYWEDEAGARTYAAKDEVYHTTTGVATVYTYCRDCGKTISETKGVAYNAKETHTFVNGVCSKCNYACTHGKTTSSYTYEGGQGTYKPYDNEYHEYTYKTTTYDTCDFCGMRLNEVKGVDRTYKEEHDYNSKGICEDCGFDSTACAHAHTYVTYSWNYDVKRTYTPDGDSGHKVTGKATEYVRCYDCDVIVKETKDLDYTEKWGHDFDEKGVCADCGYTCTHSKGSYQVRQENNRYEDTGDIYNHNRTYDVTKAFRCQYCDQVIGDKQVVTTKTVPEAHSYSQGICADCKHTCAHVNTQTYTTLDDKQRDTYESVDDQYHNRKQETRVITYCTDCGMTISAVAGEPRITKLTHSYAKNGVCRDCEHACTHSDYSDETRYVSARYEAVNDECHNYIVTRVEYKQCQFCDLEFDVSDPIEKAYTYSHNYNSDGYCDSCNYACTHSKVLTDSYMEDYKVEDAGSDDYHNEVGEVFEVSTCSYCGHKGEPVSKGVQTRPAYHSYYGYYDDDDDEYYDNNDGVCTQCGHVLGTNCDHAVISTEYSFFGKRTYAPVDELVHTVTGRAYAYDTCEKCGAQVAKRVVESYTEEYEHDYDENGVCEDCGYTRTCAHLHVREVINWDSSKKQTYADVNADYHTVTGPRYTSRYCLDCGTVLEKVSRGVETVKAEHSFSHGVCSDCGRKQECAHKDTYEWTGYDGKAIYTAVDAKYHTVSGREIKYVQCEDCGETISKTYGDTVTKQVTHDFSSKGVCTACHFVNTCPHKNTFDNYNWERSGYREIVGDENSHEVIGYKVGYTYCQDCYQTLDTWKKRVSLGTEEHEYNKIGICYQCGHERACTHPFTMEYTTWDDDEGKLTYTYVNATTHKATVHKYKVIQCTECGAELSKTDAGTGSVYFSHSIVNGKCTVCNHAIAACKHAKTHEVVVWGGNSEYTYKDAKTHAVQGIKYVRTVCDNCYEVIKTVKTENASGVEGHSYNSAGRCACGARSNVTNFSSDIPTYLGKGETFKLTTTAYNRSNKKASLKYTFKSSNAKVVAVNSSGKLTAKKAGTATITITANNGLVRTAKVTVKALASKISLATKSKTLMLKTEDKDSFVLTCKYDSKAKTFATPTFTSSNKKVAKVNKYGVVTAVGAGKCTITAKIKNGKKATCTVTVKDPNAPKTVKIKEGKKKTLKKGKSLQLHTVLTPTTATKTITWTTSNKKVATVTKAGKVKAVGKGTATITATAVGGKKATIKITVK